MQVLKPYRLQPGDTIGVIAPSRPIYNIKKDVEAGAEILRSRGYKIKFGQNIDKHFYYSAGSVDERATDLNDMYADPEIKAIICANGGITSNQILPLIDFENIKKNPKIFIGFSDITTLLLSIYSQTGLITFHGPDLASLSLINTNSLDSLLGIISGDDKYLTLPLGQQASIIKNGIATGKLIGGYLLAANALLGTPFSPDYSDSIWFWEAIGECPAKLDFYLNQLKLADKLDQINALIIGFLSDCVDKKYPADNRPIAEIILELTKNHNFPIIQTNTFGHDTKNFQTYPIGITAKIDTQAKELILSEPPVI